MIFSKGQKIEVGVGEYDESTGEVEDGSSYFMTVDIDEIDEDVVIDTFGKTENVLYVQLVTDKQFSEWADEAKLSDYLK